MALSGNTRRRLEVALTRKTSGDEVADAIDAGFGPAMDYIAPVGALTALPVAATQGSPPSGAQVDASVNALKDAVANQLGLLQAKVDALLAGMVADGKMDAS